MVVCLTCLVWFSCADYCVSARFDCLVWWLLRAGFWELLGCYYGNALKHALLVV